jgi:2-keto-4-pentenoate hydratase
MPSGVASSTMIDLDSRVRAGLESQLDDWRGKLASGAQRIGWKMGRGVEEVEALMGARPVIGHLVSSSMLAPGGPGRVPLDASRAGATLRAETELGLQLGHAVTAETELEEARDAITGLFVAFELVDVGPPRGDVVRVLAGNVFHLAFACGPTGPVAETAERSARLAVDGEVRGCGSLLDDYAETVVDAARLLAAFGERLIAGDRLIVGSSVHVPIALGDQVTSSIDGLRDVSADLTT